MVVDEKLMHATSATVARTHEFASVDVDARGLHNAYSHPPISFTMLRAHSPAVMTRWYTGIAKETTAVQPNRIASHNQNTLLLRETTRHAHDSKPGIRVTSD